MPKITHIETQPYHVKLKSSLSWGVGHKLTDLNHVLIRVMLDDGAIGIAEATPRPTIYGETQASVGAIIEQHLAPMLIGQTIEQRTDVDTLDTQLHIIKNNHTAKGALNIAIHSALAQSLNQSLQAYLGIERKHIEVSYIVGTGTPDFVIADVDAAYQAGVRVFKVKIGAHLPQEIETIDAIQALYPHAQIYVDANQCPNSR